MAPDISDKKTKVCKKYSHSDHSKYRQWEKERRARFNDKLEDLASCLPNYDKQNPWKKAEIIENAIRTLRSKVLSAKKSSDNDTIRKLSAEVNSLKDIILQFTSFDKSGEDIYQLTSQQVISILNKIILQEKENSRNETVTGGVGDADLDGEEDLAFVAKIAQSNDHCYSVNITEPNLAVDSEEVVESEELLEAVSDGNNADDNPMVPGFVTILPSTITPVNNDELITLVQDTSQLSFPQVISLEDPLTFTGVGGVRTIFVNKD